MKKYTLIMDITADDDADPIMIPDEIYNACNDVSFSFEVASIEEAADQH